MPRFASVRFLTIMALAAALALGACGDEENDTGGTREPTATVETNPTPTTTTRSEAAAEPVEVSIKDIKFMPHDIEAKVGQKIVWTNDDQGIPHDVTATDPDGVFKSDTLNTGDTFEYTPTEAGKIEYVCTIHSGQDGTITVTG